MTRMFVAVVPPESVLEDLEEFLGAATRRGPPFRWTQPDQWHLTLAFSSDVPDRSYDDLVDRLARAARKRHPVEARIAGGGAFPHVGRAKIIYAGVETDREELRRMATGARAAVAKSGAEVDGQRFKPHLTLARINRPSRRAVRPAPRRVRRPPWTVEEIALVASYLGQGPRNRARHEVVETFSLGRAGSGPAPADAPPRGR